MGGAASADVPQKGLHFTLDWVEWERWRGTARGGGWWVGRRGSGGMRVGAVREREDLLAAWFVRGRYCAYPLILTEVIARVGQLIATLVLEP